MQVMMLDKTDRLVYMETFLEGKARYASGFKAENNPYKQGSVSYMGWLEGLEQGEFEA